MDQRWTDYSERSETFFFQYHVLAALGADTSCATVGSAKVKVPYPTSRRRSLCPSIGSPRAALRG